MADHESIRVLVVEDEALVGMQLKAALEDVGYDVLGPVRTLNGAWQADTSWVFDAAVLDVNLSGESSMPFARHLMARGVAVVLLTGYDLPELPPDAARMPVLRKPLDVHVLDIILRRQLAARQSWSEPESGGLGLYPVPRLARG